MNIEKIKELNSKKETLKIRKHISLRIVYISLGIGIFIFILGIGLLITWYEKFITFFMLMLISGSIPVTLYIVFVNRIKQIDIELNDIELDIDIEGIEIDKDIAYAEKTLKTHNNQLKKYYDLNLKQNWWLLGFGLFCIILGFSIIAITIYLIFLKVLVLESQIITAVLGGIGAILTNFVAAMYLKMNSNASENLKEFHNKLIDTHKILMSSLLISKITDKQIRENTYSEIAKTISQNKNINQ